MSEPKLSLIETLMMSGLAGIGGTLSYLMRQANIKERPTMGRAVLEACSSAFVGLLAMLACQAMEISWQWAGVIVGLFGWMGAELSIALLRRLVESRFGIGKTWKQ